MGGRSILVLFWLVLLAIPLFGFNDYLVFANAPVLAS